MKRERTHERERSTEIASESYCVVPKYYDAFGLAETDAGEMGAI